MFHFGRGRLGGRVRGKWEGWREVGWSEGSGRDRGRWEEQQRGGRSSREVGGAAERWEGHNVHEDHSFNGSAGHSDSMC